MFLFAPIRWALKLLFSLIIAAAIYLVVSAVQVVFASRVPTSPSAFHVSSGVVVIENQAKSSTLSGNALARLEEGLALMEAKKTPRLFVAAPSTLPGASNALVTDEQWLTNHGIGSQLITTVKASNVAGALTTIASDLGSRASVIIVTDAVNALWTKSAASSSGLTSAIAPPSSSKKPFYSEIAAIFHEASAVASGRVIGYNRSGWGGSS